ncbi:MAG: 30S ribosomal protein S6 [Patescibacteria group bacterium]|nr:30S ribosomal protein S6 [Patescibacteria group bacterium]MDD5121252.1 30S ribosomal protein S6 [Patescibacteria group bacterium]MDD5395829.1 30S ribosomal protein S6 [Patescibacteria group bacterium]
MKKYEILYIIPSPFTETDAPEIQKNVAKILEEQGAKIISEENLDNKKLAYPIKTIKRGFYVLVNFEAEGETIKKIEEKLKLTPEVLRFQITDFVEYKKPAPTHKRKPSAKKPADTETTSIDEEPKEEPKEEKQEFKSIDDKIDELLEI